MPAETASEYSGRLRSTAGSGAAAKRLLSRRSAMYSSARRRPSAFSPASRPPASPPENVPAISSTSSTRHSVRNCCAFGSVASFSHFDTA
ncbi:MAG: hypothetical protein ACLSHG_12255 [Oscillospiraceae bacterium]